MEGLPTKGSNYPQSETGADLRGTIQPKLQPCMGTSDSLIY